MECYLADRGELRHTKVKVVGSRGLHLLCVPLDSPGEIRLVSPGEAVDQREWQRWWKKFNELSEVTWEDGTPVDFSGKIQE